MELAITEHGEQIGLLTMEQEGLFWKINCKMSSEREQLRRIFVVYLWRTEYLGIPDADGRLVTRIPRSHLPEGAQAAIAMRHPRGDWSPWCGTVAGIVVSEAFLREADDGMDLALPPQEALKFPAWAEKMRTEQVYGTQTALLRLGRDGSLPPTEKEYGGTTNEETDEMDRDVSDTLLPADTFADECDGGGSEEADRPDL